MAEATKTKLQRLIVSATELHEQHPTWSQAFIEDYLNILEDTIILADEIDGKASGLANTRLVNSNSLLLSTDDELFFVTTSGELDFVLTEVEDGRRIRLINTTDTDTGNNVNISTSTGDTIAGEATQYIAPNEVLRLTFNNLLGWW
jgi:hypothetical protein